MTELYDIIYANDPDLMMNKADWCYKKNLKEVLENGYLDVNPRPKYADGTPAHTKFITQVNEKYDISKGEFPITTLRNTAIKTGIKEVLWIYQKQNSSLESAHEMGIKWWDEWEIGDGTIGQRYGATVSRYDFVNKLLNDLKNNPFGRRHIMNLYQQTDLDETKGLFPCAYETLWSCREVDGEMYLDLTLMQRSNDYIMAGYINKIQYVALQMMFASHLGYKAGVFSHFVQNLHVYDRHDDAMKELLDREPTGLQPKIALKEDKDFYDFKVSDFIITGTEGITKIESPLEIAI